MSYGGSLGTGTTCRRRIRGSTFAWAQACASGLTSVAADLLRTGHARHNFGIGSHPGRSVLTALATPTGRRIFERYQP
jgi:hypothetical protein